MLAANIKKIITKVVLCLSIFGLNHSVFANDSLQTQSFMIGVSATFPADWTFLESWDPSDLSIEIAPRKEDSPAFALIYPPNPVLPEESLVSYMNDMAHLMMTHDHDSVLVRVGEYQIGGKTGYETVYTASDFEGTPTVNAFYGLIADGFFFVITTSIPVSDVERIQPLMSDLIRSFSYDVEELTSGKSALMRANGY
ncbi:hypothetical protein CSW98_00050 [Vibrio sp. HA2012]|uniref:hypothetical protein n=1 Tax=Vibrio sp. HA2012 TaxID=1971595 RepID=UPI000C2BF573|nr:hypothetical protein [Vibrio sp. HA2012]PJC87561.1 hypothetical protein CSW98_00050 [Vibrio sp. HA2012]